MFARKKRHHTSAHSPPQSVLASPTHAALHLVRFSREAAGLVAPGPLARALALSLALAMHCLEGGPEESGPSQHQLGLLPHSHWPRLVARVPLDSTQLRERALRSIAAVANASGSVSLRMSPCPADHLDCPEQHVAEPTCSVPMHSRLWGWRGKGRKRT